MLKRLAEGTGIHSFVCFCSDYENVILTYSWWGWGCGLGDGLCVCM